MDGGTTIFVLNTFWSHRFDGKGPSRFNERIPWRKLRCIFSAAQGARLELSSERLRVLRLDRPAAMDLLGGALVGNNLCISSGWNTSCKRLNIHNSKKHRFKQVQTDFSLQANGEYIHISIHQAIHTSEVRPACLLFSADNFCDAGSSNSSWPKKLKHKTMMWKLTWCAMSINHKTPQTRRFFCFGSDPPGPNGNGGSATDPSSRKAPRETSCDVAKSPVTWRSWDGTNNPNNISKTMQTKLPNTRCPMSGQME